MTVNSGVRAITRAIEDATGKIAAFRATVTAVDGSLIKVQREGAATANTEQYASCTRFLLSIGDVVLCIPLGGKPVVIDVIRRAAAASATYTLNLNAGTTASASVVGDDTGGQINLTPGGAGIGAGIQLQLNFAVSRPSTSFAVVLTRGESVAGDADQRVTGRTTAKFNLYSMIALTSGSAYVWYYNVYQYG